MKIGMICFTARGTAICRLLCRRFRDTGTESTGYVPRRFWKPEWEAEGIRPQDKSLSEWTGSMFDEKRALVFIGAAGFLFLARLPFTNASLDYLLRTNIENDLQGRAWGLIGLISQLGYVAAYAVSGLLADYVFTPLLLDGGALSENVGKIIGTGPGRGIGFLMILAGLLLCVTSGLLFCMKSIRNLENGGLYDT